ncbi:MAG: TonB family protein [Thermodesulfobacteriota bacterium]|nr:TonB family protein [Thermodesulfobacteriota bacterium]
MMTGSPPKKNWLFRGMIIVSLGIHALLFMHISGIYDRDTLSYIEMTLKDFEKPAARTIPRPRVRHKISDQPMDEKKILVKKQNIPRFEVEKPDNVDKTPPSLITEKIAVPDIPGAPGLQVSQWEAPPQLEDSRYMTRKEYFEMVRLRIQSKKTYPETAKENRICGRAVVRFQLFPSGKTGNITIENSSGNKDLDTAALNAVKKSLPFPRPPATLISEPVYLEISMVFELI